MSEDDRTPVTSVWDVIQRQVSANHARLNACRSQQIEAFGQDGKGGFVGTLVKDVDEMNAELRSMRKDLTEVTTAVKVAVAKAGVVAGFTAAGLSVLVKFLMGG